MRRCGPDASVCAKQNERDDRASMSAGKPMASKAQWGTSQLTLTLCMVWCPALIRAKVSPRCHSMRQGGACCSARNCCAMAVTASADWAAAVACCLAASRSSSACCRAASASARAFADRLALYHESTAPMADASPNTMLTATPAHWAATSEPMVSSSVGGDGAAGSECAVSSRSSEPTEEVSPTPVPGDGPC